MLKNTAVYSREFTQKCAPQQRAQNDAYCPITSMTRTLSNQCSNRAVDNFVIVLIIITIAITITVTITIIIIIIIIIIIYTHCYEYHCRAGLFPDKTQDRR